MENSLVYNLELTELDRELAHKPLNDIRRMYQPDIWVYANQYFQENGTPAIVEGHTFFFEKPNAILVSKLDKRQYPKLKAFIEWAHKNLPVKKTASSILGTGMQLWCKQKIVGLPDGTWAAFSGVGYGWTTIDLEKGGWDNKPGFAPSKAANSNYMPLCTSKQTPPLNRIINGFFESWKKARKDYRRKLSETGELRARIEQDKNEQMVDWTRGRMAMATSAKALKDDLDELVKALESDMITNDDFGRIYSSLTTFVRVAKDTQKNHTRKLRANKRGRKERS